MKKIQIIQKNRMKIHKHNKCARGAFLSISIFQLLFFPLLVIANIFVFLPYIRFNSISDFFSFLLEGRWGWLSLLYVFVACISAMLLIKNKKTGVRIAEIVWVAYPFISIIAPYLSLINKAEDVMFFVAMAKVLVDFILKILLAGFIVLFFLKSSYVNCILKSNKPERANVSKIKKNKNLSSNIVKFVIFSSGIVLCLLGSLGFLNYIGVCFEEGKILSDEELARPFFKQIFSLTKDIVWAYDQLPEQSQPILHFETENTESYYNQGGFDNPPLHIDTTQLIHYKSFEEFVSVNPECCSVTNSPAYGLVGEIGFWDKVVGRGAGFVNVKFRIRYYDREGKIRTKWSGFSSKRTNCGGRGNSSCWP